MGLCLLDPFWIRIQRNWWIRVQEENPTPKKKKKFTFFHVGDLEASPEVWKCSSEPEKDLRIFGVQIIYN
jgi:hypothetical protein